MFVHVTDLARSSKVILSPERVHSTKATVESISQSEDDVTASSLYKDQLARNRGRELLLIGVHLDGLDAEACHQFARGHGAGRGERRRNMASGGEPRHCDGKTEAAT